MTLLIRPATVDDAEGIARVHIATWQRAYAHALPAAYLDGLELAPRVERWRSNIGEAAPPVQAYVAVVDDRVVGFVAVGPQRADGWGQGEVYAIYVHPDHWSTGAGWALLDRGVVHLREAGFTEVSLWVLADNPRARRFYERYGLTFDGTTKQDTIGADSPHATVVDEVRYRL
jgi:ribosomal protein S18 acetylase RimI-like enzyme